MYPEPTSSRSASKLLFSNLTHFYIFQNGWFPALYSFLVTSSIFYNALHTLLPVAAAFSASWQLLYFLKKSWNWSNNRPLNRWANVNPKHSCSIQHTSQSAPFSLILIILIIMHIESILLLYGKVLYTCNPLTARMKLGEKKLFCLTLIVFLATLDSTEKH